VNAKRLLAIYGVAVVLTYAISSWRGWSLATADKVQNVPKSVRDNPGVYRSHYAGRPSHYGGK